MSLLTKSKLLLKPLPFFLIVSVFFGLLLVFLQPPMAVNDEISHFSRAYEISHGVLLTHKMHGVYEGNLGGPVPQAIVDLDHMNSYSGRNKPSPKVLKAGTVKAAHASINSQDTTKIPYSNTANYSPLTYLPQALAISIARIFNLSVLTTVYLVRFVVLVSCIVLFGLAIRISPSKKWLFVLVGLLPMVIQESASASSDGLLIANCCLYVAIFLHCFTHKQRNIQLGRFSLNLLPIMALAILYASLAKPVYFPLFLTAFFLPSQVIGRSRASKAFILGCVVIIPFLLLGIWNVAIAHQGVAQAQRLSVEPIGITPPTTIEGVNSLLHPAYTAKLLLHTYVFQPDKNHVIPNYILQGFFGSFDSYFINPPLWFDWSVLFSLVLALFMREEKLPSFSRRLILMTLFGLLCAFVGISLSMFFYTTTNHQNFINGVQGRYFLPLIIFAIFLISRQKLIVITNSLRSHAYLAALIVFNLLWMQIVLYRWFWVA